MHRLAIALLGAVCALQAPIAESAGTLAGTSIANQAEISYNIGTETRTRTTNVVEFAVAEIIDVDLLIQTPERLVTAGDTAQPLLFRLTNTGNGTEAWSLSPDVLISGDNFDPILAFPSLIIDSDRSGGLSAADQNYVPGTNDPVLNPDEFVDIFLLADIPAGLLDAAFGFTRLDVASTTGTGATGSTIPGAGDGGVDVVFGPSGGNASQTGEYLVGQINLMLSKAATVTDPDGGDLAVSGAMISYTIQVVADGTGSAANTIFYDPIPANTQYVSGSLQLNGIGLTDASDVDAGEYLPVASEVQVRLGDIAAVDPAAIVQFSVTIN